MISLYPFGDEIYAFGETPIIHKINSDTLETEKKVDISRYISIVHHTSHPHVLNNGKKLICGIRQNSTICIKLNKRNHRKKN